MEEITKAWESMSTREDWLSWGKENPYFGVYSDKKFLGKDLSEHRRKEFFASGEKTIDELMEKLKKTYGFSGKFEKALDFGCGVGRLSIPLASHAKKVLGIDVSAPMVAEAKKNAGRMKIKNVDFKIADPELTVLPKKYDLVFSTIVIQHIPPRRGYKEIDMLLKHLSTSGFASLQLTYDYKRSRSGRALLYIRERIPPVRYVANIVKGRRFNTPNMRMHKYNLNKIFDIYYKNRMQNLSIDFTNHGGFIGVNILARKST